MSVIHRMILRARHGRTSRLGQCLARLDGADIAALGCLQLRIYPLAVDAQTWQVEGQWRSVAARDAFLASAILRQVLAEAISEDLIASLECNQLALQQAA